MQQSDRYCDLRPAIFAVFVQGRGDILHSGGGGVRGAGGEDDTGEVDGAIRGREGGVGSAVEADGAAIPHAGGRYEPKKPFGILAGILTVESYWKTAFGEEFIATAEKLGEDSRIDVG